MGYYTELSTDKFLTYRANQMGISPKELRIMRFYECKIPNCERKCGDTGEGSNTGLCTKHMETFKKQSAVHRQYAKQVGIMSEQSPEQK